MPPDRPVRSSSPGGSPLPATPVPEVRVKPRLRGVSHQYAFFVSLASGTLLVLLTTTTTTKASVAAAIYAASVSALFGVSALYHRSTWTTPARRRMRRLDHAMIFLLIAGTYTPVGLLVLQGMLATVVLAVVWGGALAGIVLELAWTTAPRWLGGTVYLALGWVAVVAMPQLFARLGMTGGLVYSAGAAVYALRRPDPAPAVFGYHEVFHLLVIAGVAAHFLAISLYALPPGEHSMRNWRSATGSLATDPPRRSLPVSVRSEQAVAMNRRQVITTAGHDRCRRIATGRLG